MQVFLFQFYINWLLKSGFVFFTFLFALSAAADSHYYKTAVGSDISIDKRLEFYREPGVTLSLEELLAQNPLWQKSDNQLFSRGFSQSAWWVRFNVYNTHESTDWMLEISYSVLDDLNIYIAHNDAEIEHFAMGDNKPFAQRPIDHRNFLVPLRLEQNATATIYIRVSSTSAVQLPMKIWDGEQFNQLDSNRSLVEGIYFGGLLAIGFFNVLLFLVLRDKIYIFYVMNVVSAALFVACLHGWTFQFIWPNATSWNDTAILFFLCVNLMSCWLFSAEFLTVSKLPKPYPLIHDIGTVISILFIAFVLWLPYHAAVICITPYALFTTIWGFALGIRAWRSGNSAALYYLVAWSMLLCGGIVLGLNKFNLIPDNFITDASLQIGSLLDVLIFALALADRINKERSLLFEAQRKSLIAKTEANQILEQRVAERTMELQSANTQLQLLSDTDQLTGLKNRRFLEKMLEAEFQRAQRYQRCISILLIDIDHFKKINDRFGHVTGDHCLKSLAEILQGAMRRTSDLISRYGGEEFCAVLPELDRSKAKAVAQQICDSVSAQPLTFAEQPIPVSVSIGVYSAVPGEDDEIINFIASADRALYEAKMQGRNRVVVGDDDESKEPFWDMGQGR